MKFLRTIMIIITITAISLLYVHQQIQLVMLSYSIDCKEKKVKEALDLNERLGYTIDNLENPSRLESVLISKKIDVAFPKKGNVVRLAKINANAGNKEMLSASATEGKTTLITGILEFFSPRAEAHAKEK